jgi:hypothetical protein
MISPCRFFSLMSKFLCIRSTLHSANFVHKWKVGTDLARFPSCRYQKVGRLFAGVHKEG